MPKITELTNYTTPNASTDVLPIVDVSNDTTKKITVENLLNSTPDASPTFATVKLTNLTDGYIPKHTNDSTGLEDSPIYTDGTKVGIGTTAPNNLLTVGSSASAAWNSAYKVIDISGYGYLYGSSNGTGWSGTGYGQTGWGNNQYYNGASYAIETGAASFILQGAGQISFAVAPPVTAGCALTFTEAMHIANDGKVGIGTASPSYQLQLSTDSAAKPSTNTWTVTSDERLKTDIQLADLNRCLEIVKSLPLKYYRWRDDIYSPEAVKDRGMLGWIATDVEQVFPKAVDIIPKYTGDVEIEDGVEEYEEQDYTIETIEREVKIIEIRNGVPVQVTKTVTEEKKTLLYDEVNVVDEQGNVVLKEDGTPLTYQVPRMVKKTRPKKSRVEIENCKTVNSDQIIKVLYGAVQLLIQKVEQLEARVA